MGPDKSLGECCSTQTLRLNQLFKVDQSSASFLIISLFYYLHYTVVAFLLFAKDYDVWLANTRGSRYGQNHTTLALSHADFWSYSFHEVGAFDLPVIVDHIRDMSSFHQLIVVTHSEVNIVCVWGGGGVALLDVMHQLC